MLHGKMLPRFIIGLYTYKVQVQSKTWRLINTHNLKTYIMRHVYTILVMHMYLPMYVFSILIHIDKIKYCYFAIPRASVTFNRCFLIKYNCPTISCLYFLQLTISIYSILHNSKRQFLLVTYIKATYRVIFMTIMSFFFFF